MTTEVWTAKCYLFLLFPFIFSFSSLYSSAFLAISCLDITILVPSVLMFIPSVLDLASASLSDFSLSSCRLHAGSDEERPT